MHYVCSDIHGQYDLYKKMIETIDLQDNDTLYVIGDVIDRGPDSIGIIKDMMKRKNVEMFLGNHELMMIDYITDTGRPDIWTLPNNGGITTRNKFLACSEDEQQKIFDYISNAWIQKFVEVDGEKYALHHSAMLFNQIGQDVRFNEVKSWRSVFTAVWYSPYRFQEYIGTQYFDDGYTHILGHVPVPLIYEGQDIYFDSAKDTVEMPYEDPDLPGKLFNIDGGCALIRHGKRGGLYCMRLEKDENGKRPGWYFLKK